MAEKLADMRLTKSQKKKMFGNYCSPVAGGGGPDYPWGMEITLDSVALDKLGIDELPDAGELCQIMAVGKVTRVSSSASDKKTERSVTVQITRLSLVAQDTDDDIYEKAKADRKARA